MGISAIHDDKVRPWLRPFSDVFLPENDDSGDSTDSTDPTDGADPENGDDTPADPDAPDNDEQGDGGSAEDEGEDLTMDDVVNALNEQPRAEAEAILRRYHCQQAQQLPANHFLRANRIARHC